MSKLLIDHAMRERTISVPGAEKYFESAFINKQDIAEAAQLLIQARSSAIEAEIARVQDNSLIGKPASLSIQQQKSA